MNYLLKLTFAGIFVGLVACSPPPQPPSEITPISTGITPELNEAHCREVLSTHLNAVTQKDLAVLKSTLMPSGEMNLILPGTPPSHTSKEFLNYHAEWFADTTWTFSTTINGMEVGQDVALAWVSIRYEEPERDGVPYFNEMMVSYGLKKVDGHWYVRHDHACSLRKSTDDLN